MSEYAVMVGVISTTALLLWSGTTLSRSPEEWIKWGGMIVFNIGLIFIIGIMAVAYQIVDNHDYLLLDQPIEMLLIVASIVVLLFVALLSIRTIMDISTVFKGTTETLMSRIKKINQNNQEESEKVRR
jgi:uncharacterized protein YsxB (DUF464 family)